MVQEQNRTTGMGHGFGWARAGRTAWPTSLGERKHGTSISQNVTRPNKPGQDMARTVIERDA